MSAVSESIVREYFEQHGFLCGRTASTSPRGKQEMDGIDFFVWNPQPGKPETPVPFILIPTTLSAVNRAIVVVRGWHTESFGPALLANSPEIFRFVEPSVFQQAARVFNPDLASH